MTTVTLSEKASRTNSIGSQATLYRKCSYSHPAIRYKPDDWRDIPKRKQVSHSCLGNLPDATPLATDGIRFLAIRADGTYFIGHFTNLIKPERQVAARKPRQSVIPRKTKRTDYNLDDLL